MLDQVFTRDRGAVAVEMPGPVADLIRLCLRRELDAQTSGARVVLGGVSEADPLARWEAEALQAEMQNRLEQTVAVARADVLAAMGEAGSVSCRLEQDAAISWLNCLNRTFVALRTRELGTGHEAGHAQSLAEFFDGSSDAPALGLTTAVMAVLVETLAIALTQHS